MMSRIALNWSEWGIMWYTLYNRPVRVGPVLFSYPKTFGYVGYKKLIDSLPQPPMVCSFLFFVLIFKSECHHCSIVLQLLKFGFNFSLLDVHVRALGRWSSGRLANWKKRMSSFVREMALMYRSLNVHSEAGARGCSLKQTMLRQ